MARFPSLIFPCYSASFSEECAVDDIVIFYKRWRQSLWFRKFVQRREVLVDSMSDSTDFKNFRKRFRLPPSLFFDTADEMRPFFSKTRPSQGKPTGIEDTGCSTTSST